MFNRTRVPKGTPAKGGQFTAASHDEAAVSLVAGPDADLSKLRDLSEDQLLHLAYSASPPVREAILRLPNVSDSVLAALAEPTQPVAVRVSTAATMFPGTAERAASDPDPLVRAHAAVWSLDENQQEELLQDRGVRHVLDLLRTGTKGSPS